MSNTMENQQTETALTETPKKKSKAMIWICSVLVLVITVLVGLGIYFSVANTTKEAPKQDGSDSSSEVNLFHDGLLAVLDGDKCGYIDKEGKEVIECRYATASVFYDDGYAIVNRSSDGKDIIIDKDGKEIARYTNIDKYDDIIW